MQGKQGKFPKTYRVVISYTIGIIDDSYCVANNNSDRVIL